MLNGIDSQLSPRLQAITIVGSILLFLIIIRLIRTRRMQTGYALLWLVMGVFLLLFSLSNNLLFGFSNLVGIYYVPAVIFLTAIVYLILIMIHFSTVISRQKEQINDLAQEITILKNNIKRKGSDR